MICSKKASNLHGHTMKVIKKGLNLRLGVGKFSFSNRVVNERNAPSKEIIITE